MAVIRRQGGRCAGPCRDTLPETYQLDHRLPWCLTHDDTASNLDALCPNCHAIKTRHEASALHALARLQRECPRQRFCHRCYRVVSAWFAPHACDAPVALRPKLDTFRTLRALRARSERDWC